MFSAQMSSKIAVTSYGNGLQTVFFRNVLDISQGRKWPKFSVPDLPLQSTALWGNIECSLGHTISSYRTGQFIQYIGGSSCIPSILTEQSVRWEHFPEAFTTLRKAKWGKGKPVARQLRKQSGRSKHLFCDSKNNKKKSQLVVLKASPFPGVILKKTTQQVWNWEDRTLWFNLGRSSAEELSTKRADERE